MSSDLRFPKGPPTPIGTIAVDEFINLAKKIANGRKFVLETLKGYFCRASGKSSYSSSSVSWAESDLESDANIAAEDGPAFLAAFFDACQELKEGGFAVVLKLICA